MFKCDRCKCDAERGEKPTRKVIEWRNKEYYPRQVWGQFGEIVILDRGGIGWEIVREESWCKRCTAPAIADVESNEVAI